MTKISIGMPVYNGELFIRDTIEAILAQTFTDFELIISDNASTDATEKICRLYAEKDARIRYSRLEQNIGAAGNFNRVFELSSGEYFKWAAHDDLHSVDYLAKCVEVLDTDCSVVLCHSQVQIIDQTGQFIQDYQIKLNTDSLEPNERFGELLSHHLCYQIFGLIRTKTLKKTGLMGNYGHTDGVLLAKIALQGKFYEIPEPLFLARKHSQQSMSLFFPAYLTLASGNFLFSREIPDYHAYTIWFDPTQKEKIIFPHWRIFWEYWLCIWRSSLSTKKQIVCYFLMFEQFQEMKFLLIEDLIMALGKIKINFQPNNLARKARRIQL